MIYLWIQKFRNNKWLYCSRCAATQKHSDKGEWWIPTIRKAIILGPLISLKVNTEVSIYPIKSIANTTNSKSKVLYYRKCGGKVICLVLYFKHFPWYASQNETVTLKKIFLAK